MPRYFFHLYNDVTACDEEGLELADFETARLTAIKSARDMAAQSVLEGGLNLEHRIEIQDDKGAVLGTVRFGDVVSVEPLRAH